MKKKKQTYLVTIPQPCHEKWNEMTTVEKGKFCNQCSKTVIDFTKMSDREIIGLMQESTSKVCGHFKNNQLNRPLENYQLKTTPSFYPFPQLLTGFLLLGMPSCDFAQTRGEITTEKVIEGENHLGKVLISPSVINSSEKNDEKNTISGQLVDDITSEPIGGISINLFSNGTPISSVNSDENGKFSIQLPEITDDKLQLIIFSYQTKNINIDRKKDLPWNQTIRLSQAECLDGEIELIMGDVMIIEDEKPKKKGK